MPESNPYVGALDFPPHFVEWLALSLDLQPALRSLPVAAGEVYEKDAIPGSHLWAVFSAF